MSLSQSTETKVNIMKTLIKYYKMQRFNQLQYEYPHYSLQRFFNKRIQISGSKYAKTI